MATSLYTKSSWYVEQLYLYHQVGLTSQNSDLCILKLQDRDYGSRSKAWVILTCDLMVLTHAEQDCLWYHTMLSTTKFKSRGIFEVSRLTRGNHCVEGYGHESVYTKSSWYVEQVYLYHQVGLTSQNSDLCILKLKLKIGIRDPDQRLEWYQHVVLWFWHMLSKIHLWYHTMLSTTKFPQIENHSKSLQANTWERLCWGIWPRVCILSHHGM